LEYCDKMSDSETSSSSDDSDLYSDEDEDPPPSNDVQMKAMLAFLSEGGIKINSSYTVGSSNWRDLWSVAINAMSGTTGQRYRINDKSESLPSLCSAAKTSKFEPAQSTSLPGIRSRSAETHDQVDVPYPAVSNESGSIRDVVRILTREKQVYLLKVLGKMEANLEMMDVTSGIGVKKPVRLKTSESLKYAFDKKLKYGRTASGNGEINGVLRKIGTMLKSGDGKKKLAAVSSVCIFLPLS
jgi:hypothetical protein